MQPEIPTPPTVRGQDYEDPVDPRSRHQAGNGVGEESASRPNGIGQNHQAQVDPKQELFSPTAIPTIVVQSPEEESWVVGEILVRPFYSMRNQKEFTAITNMKYDMQPEMVTPPTRHVRRRQFLQSVTIVVVSPSVFYGVQKRCKTRDGATPGKGLQALPGLHNARAGKRSGSRGRKDPVLLSPMSREPLWASASRTRIDGHSHTATKVCSSEVVEFGGGSDSANEVLGILEN
jgi:hypothetical protein